MEWVESCRDDVLVYALYHRNWRLATTLLVWLVLNPAAFHPPETTDAWTTRGVLAEREWQAASNGTMGPAWSNLLDLLNAPATAFLGWATLQRRPAHTVLATALMMGLKLLWIAEIIELTGVEPGEPMPAF